MAEYTNITFNGVTLYILNATPLRNQKTRKSIIGKQLVQTSIIGINARQWEITMGGIIIGDDVEELGVKRAAIEALDDVQFHAYVDGIHDGTYMVIPGSLQFKDNSDDAGMVYRYSFQIVEQ